MLWDVCKPTGMPAEVWNVIGPSSAEENQISDIAATSDHKWLFTACGKGWWAKIDIQQDKCASRQHCTPDPDRQLPRPISVAVSPDDHFFYIVTDTGTVESYDIQAEKSGEVKTISNQFFTRITVDHSNQFVFIASQSGNLYKYDTA